jgi:hypothetical protein
MLPKFGWVVEHYVTADLSYMNIVDRKKWNDILNVILNTNFTADFF